MSNLSPRELEIAHEIGHDVPGYITGALPLPAKEDPINQMCVRHRMLAMVRRIAELEAEVAKCRRVLTKSLANFNRKHRAHRQALAELLVVNVRLRADGERLDAIEQRMRSGQKLSYCDHSEMFFLTEDEAYKTLREAADAARKV